MRSSPMSPASGRTRPCVPILAVAVLWLGPAAAGAGGPLAEQGCTSCHRVEAPAASERTVEALAERRGPDLFYAGSKFRVEWLREWLAEPERIRPAGLAPHRHAETVDGGDHLRTDALEPHPALDGEALDAVVAELERLDWGEEKLPDTLPTAPPVPRSLAEMNFVKFKGCASCHRTAPEFGGLSGPELHSAWERLRPGFLASYIADPQAWDPVAPMPGYDLPDPEVAKLVHYLRLISEEREDD